ncbi:MAG: GDSL-type esterase/lipase family protein [Janthinobacterium lividum]
MVRALLPFLLSLLLVADHALWAQPSVAVSQPVVADSLPTAVADSLQSAHPFLNVEANHIENATIGLQHFYQRLGALPNGRVRVVHIGDSHVQADEFSGRVRHELQRTYGNAGRGLVFPFRVARTNGSPSFRTALLAGRWQARRVLARPDTALPVGVSGFVLATNDSEAAFTLRIPAQYLPGYGFNQLTLLRQPGPAAFDWQVRSGRGDWLGALLGAAPGGALTLPLDSMLDTVTLHTVRTTPGQTKALLFGLLLDNGRAGVVYHAIGVNGAAVRHYNRAPQFFEQLPVLEPDLLIVSLGTNDAYEPGFEPAVFQGQLDTLVSRLRRRCPQADVLLCGPADSYRARRVSNPDLRRLSAVLRTYALAHDLAYWDFATVQGGDGSMGKWQATGLAQPDFIHFTTKGYELQGLLLYLALQDGFAAFPR